MGSAGHKVWSVVAFEMRDPEHNMFRRNIDRLSRLAGVSRQTAAKYLDLLLAEDFIRPRDKHRLMVNPFHIRGPGGDKNHEQKLTAIYQKLAAPPLPEPPE